MSQKKEQCCTPPAEEKTLLAAGDCTPEELWGDSRPTCPKWIGSPSPLAGEGVEVIRWQLKGFLPGVEGMCKAAFRPIVVLADDYDSQVTRLQAENAALQQRLNEADQRVDELEAQLAKLIPDGYCLMPRHLTAENGAKALLLLGEFKVTFARECPECCELEEPTEGCEVCDGEGEFALHQLISWDQIEYIYSKAVGGLAFKTENAQPAQ